MTRNLSRPLADVLEALSFAPETPLAFQPEMKRWLTDAIDRADQIGQANLATDGGLAGILLIHKIVMNAINFNDLELDTQSKLMRWITSTHHALLFDDHPAMRIKRKTGRPREDEGRRKLFKEICVLAAEALERSGKSEKEANDAVARAGGQAHSRYFGRKPKNKKQQGEVVANDQSLNGTTISDWRKDWFQPRLNSTAGVKLSEFEEWNVQRLGSFGSSFRMEIEAGMFLKMLQEFV